MVVCWVLGLVWVVGVGLGGRGCTSVAEDGGGNPLVVGRQDTVGAFSGLRVVEDAAQLVADLRNRNWVDAAVDQAGAVASVAGAAADPLGEAIAAGVAWVLDHLGALREWLDGLAGDPGAVAGGAATWANVSTYLTECAQDLDRSLQTTLADQRCLTVGAYRDYQGVTVKNLESAAGMAGAVAAALEVASMIVQVVHDMVRDAIADVIGKASSKLILTAVTAGVAAPWAVASVTADVLEWVTYLSGRVKGILRSSSNLGDRLRQVRDLLEEIRTTMSRALSPAGPVPAMAAAGAGGSRPRGGRPRTATGSKNGGGGGGGRKPPTKTPGDGSGGGGANEPRYNNPELARKSKEAYERAKETKDRLAKRYKDKTTSSDNAKTLSGWGKRRPKHFQKPNVREVFELQEKIGHPRLSHFRDNGVEGRYLASHAERQEAVTAVEPAIGVSKRLCEDCHDFFIRLAQHEGREWYVTDPGGTSVFRPDGTRLGPDGQVTGLGQGYRYSERGARRK